MLSNKSYEIEGKKVDCLFNMDLSALLNYFANRKIVLLVDENLYHLHAGKFIGYNIIIIPSGEINKTQTIVDRIINQLLEWQLNKDDLIIGIGGGVVTDITGYVASIYKRGIRFGLMPTTILSMVDAAIGGKNGVNVGLHKNMVGTIYQPEFISYDFTFLETLPDTEWVNGFAEIIKHACILDATLFPLLQQHEIKSFQKDQDLLKKLIIQNIDIKFGVVQSDVNETGNRKLLNFGHTFGHAIENLQGISHGAAVSIGMVIAAKLSESFSALTASSTIQIIELLKRYGLPVFINADSDSLFNQLIVDKKRTGNDIQFVFLNTIGTAVIKNISIDNLRLAYKDIAK
jgi:3-dehydroquinate synthase